MSGGEPLALAMAAGTIMISPVGIAQGGSELLSVSILAIGAGVAVLSSVIPYTLELEALRRMPSNVFGVLMSLEPAAASIAGFLILGQDLVAREIVAIGLVVAASAGAARGSRVPPRDA
jgi:inner membrane transporter RhtA